MVFAVDWGSCIADGSCIQACPVSVFNGIGQKIMCKAVEMVNATSAGSDTAPTIESEQAIDEKFDGIRYVFFLI